MRNYTFKKLGDARCATELVTLVATLRETTMDQLRGERGDLTIQELVQRHKIACYPTILDFVITDTDAPSYGHQPSKKPSTKDLEKAVKRKKEKCLEACREHRQDFIPMAYSLDGLAGKEVRAAEKRLTSLLVSKWDRPYSEMTCLLVMTRMSLSIVQSISMLLCGIGPWPGSTGPSTAALQPVPPSPLGGGRWQPPDLGISHLQRHSQVDLLQARADREMLKSLWRSWIVTSFHYCFCCSQQDQTDLDNFCDLSNGRVYSSIGFCGL
ncbi:hypothetical protein THAOC_32655 [Thalassiosira oceanica]|uniref:Uncharacterized protein n=1 Tax=Thalassiosira oceanica TaxID=159749 RepID=K0RP70_THAOC|nr:hypothetical protein THAOC_32655 [Thalassiosira oceanica]|eukprot:EJK48537.1 hypothetical protein THAOC_32655 [Thalassiosira oceanica]